MPCTISTERTSSCLDTHLYHTKQLQRDKIKHLLLVELDVGYLVNFLKVYGFLDRGVCRCWGGGGLREGSTKKNS